MLGPLLIDLEGLTLNQLEQEYLEHPAVGGVVLFERNYHSPEQLAELCNKIHRIRDPQLLVCVDHEGGRVQRFKSGFTQLPEMAKFAQQYQENPQQALPDAQHMGYVMANELKQHGVDLSFAPVLDLDLGISHVLRGGRAISAEIDTTIAIAHAYMQGMQRAGMATVGKHFPGHGAVAADSHHALPVDERTIEQVYYRDMQPFVRLMPQLTAIMPAHIIFPNVDNKPVSLSQVWLQQILRQHLKYNGAIISDCLSMQAAVEIAPNLVERVQLALGAGCDIVLVCNNQQELPTLLDQFSENNNVNVTTKIQSLLGT